MSNTTKDLRGKSEFRKLPLFLVLNPDSGFSPGLCGAEFHEAEFYTGPPTGGFIASHSSPRQEVTIRYLPLDHVGTADEILLLLSPGLLSPFGHEPRTTKENVY